MKQVQVGQVVCYQGQFYLFAAGKEFGTYQLIPVKVDDSREKVPFTSEMELHSMNGRSISYYLPSPTR